MKCPQCLKRKNRPVIPNNKFHQSHYMWVRHIPGVDWKEDDNLPDFSKIKVDKEQSLFWCAYSIPIWARFKSPIEYCKKNAIVGYNFHSITHSGIYDNRAPNFSYNLRHDPLDWNYSHCVIVSNCISNKTIRRGIRNAIKLNAIVPLKPSQHSNFFYRIIERLKMLKYRFNPSIKDHYTNCLKDK